MTGSKANEKEILANIWLNWITFYGDKRQFLLFDKNQKFFFCVCQMTINNLKI